MEPTSQPTILSESEFLDEPAFVKVRNIVPIMEGKTVFDPLQNVIEKHLSLLLHQFQMTFADPVRIALGSDQRLGSRQDG